MTNEPTFDAKGRHYFVDAESVTQADGYEFISTAWVDQEDFEDRTLHVEFRDGYLGDFESESIAQDFDERLQEMPEIEEVYHEDREYVQVTYAEGQDLPTLIQRIDARITELSEFSFFVRTMLFCRVLVLRRLDIGRWGYFVVGVICLRFR